MPLAWRVLPGGKFRPVSPPSGGSILAEWRRIEGEEAPVAGRVEVRLQGAGGKRTALLGEEEWGVALRPPLPDDAEAAARAARRAFEAGEVEAGSERIRVALSRAGAGEGRAALLHALGDGLLGAGRLAEAGRAFDEAVEAASGIDALPAVLLEAQCRLLRSAEEPAEAEARCARSLAQRRAAGKGDGLLAASLLQQLGALAALKGDAAAGDAGLKEALAIAEREAPASLLRARCLLGLARSALDRNRLDDADRLSGEALALARSREPAGPDVAEILNVSGIVRSRRGESREAEERYLTALRILEVRRPGSVDAAHVLNSLGVLSLRRGRLDEAESYYRSALEIFQRVSPRSLRVAGVLQNLGRVQMFRGDLAEAEASLKRSLALREELAPLSRDVAASYSSLANLARESGNLPEAERWFRRSLALRKEKAPGSIEEASALSTVGSILLDQGKLDEARPFLLEAEAMQAAQAPGSLPHGDTLTWLGLLESERGRTAEAEALLDRALAIRRRLAPGSFLEAEGWRAVAENRERAGRRDEAIAAHLASLDALEAQSGRLGGTAETRGSFAARYAAHYRDAVARLVDASRGEEAFAVLERSRSRGFLALLAERDLSLDADVPEPLRREKRRLDAEYDGLQGELARIPAGDEKRRAEAEEARRRLAAERSEVAERIRTASPRAAAAAPRPLGLAEVRRSLEPGTVLLSYSLHDDRSLLFVVRPEPEAALRVVRLPRSRQELGEDVALFRSLLLRGRESPRLDPALLSLARSLFDSLLAPASAEIEASRRVLVCPDGPLFGLPFAALARSAEPPGWVARWRPLHFAASATLHAELEARPAGEPAPLGLLAVGDPAGRAAAAAPEAAAGPLLRRLSAGLPPLPRSREEAVAVAALFAPSSEALLGAAATEEAVVERAPRARRLHLACHALVDGDSPLDSGLALAPSSAGAAGKNGVLQAWEILENLRLRADLVVLSACETGLGRSLSGEGVLGLARAFQFAGARSVVSSLWTVADRSAAELMKAFYGRLAAGAPKDEALRDAQEALLSGPFPHPYHWAAFQLQGAAR